MAYRLLVTDSLEYIPATQTVTQPEYVACPECGGSGCILCDGEGVISLRTHALWLRHTEAYAAWQREHATDAWVGCPF